MNGNKVSKLSILVSAHEVSPLHGSECSSGWNLLSRIGNYHHVTVFYAKTNQFNTSNYENAVREELKSRPDIKTNFIPVSQPKITKFIAKINSLVSPKKTSIGLAPLYFLGVYFWEKKVFRKTKFLMKENAFDIIHHFNHISYREPGFLHKIGTPFIWGPTSGTFDLPIAFARKKSINFKFKILFRNLINNISKNMSLRVKKAIKNSSMIMYVTDEDKKFFQRKNARKLKYMPDTGSETKNIDTIKYKNFQLNSRDKLNIIWVGRLDNFKSLDILFDALILDPELSKNINLDIIGTGELENSLKKKADSLATNSINWHGKIKHEIVMNHMSNADILVHTSIKEAGSAVILEALSVGLPVICHDAFGFKFSINNSCGLKVPYVDPMNSKLGFYNAIKKCAKDRLLLESMKKGALIRANDLSWDSLAKSISLCYEEVAQ